MQLLTWHGTIVCLIENGGGLVHVAPARLKPEHVPVALALEGLPLGRARLAHPLLGPLAVAMPAPGRPLTLERYGRFLSANPKNMAMSFDRPAASHWEEFLPVSERAMALLRHLVSQDWVEQASGRRIGRDAIVADEGFRLDVGGLMMELPDLLAGLPREGDWPPPQISLPRGESRVVIVPAGADAAAGDGARAAPSAPRTTVAPPASSSRVAPPQGPGDGAEAARETVAGWAMREMASWRLAPLNTARAEAIYDELNQTRGWAALYRFEDGTVRLLPKPEAVKFGEIASARTVLYQKFFEAAAKRLPGGLAFTLCMGVGDGLSGEFEAPVFTFQKSAFDRLVLVPDIDFLGGDFFEDEAFADTIDHADKTCSAVFSGSTTGGPITPEVARTNALPRLAAAAYFDGSERVDVRLPSIVQCPSDEAREILLSRSFCQKPRLSREEQYRHRFLISIDGNGATCSRVALALASNSVLMKYQSPNVLYYFAALQPWVHFIPITRHADVDGVLDMEAERPGRFAAIASQGRQFARSYLTRDSALHYTAELLLLYAESLGQRRAGTVTPAPAPATLPPPTGVPLRVMAHIQRRGDIWSGADGWVGVPGSRQAIEGLTIEGGAGLPANSGLRYQVASEPQAWGEVTRTGAYAGSRGRRLPLRGVRLVVDPASWRGHALSLEARFADGTAAGPVSGETTMEVSGEAPLEAIRLQVTTREPAG